MAGNRTVRVQVGDYVQDVALQFQLLKLLCENNLDPYVILAEQRTNPSATLGLSTTRAVEVLHLVTGQPADSIWQWAVEHSPLSVIDAAADVLIAFATAGRPARKGKGRAEGDERPKG